MTSPVMSQRVLEYCPLYSCLGEGDSVSNHFVPNILRMNANIVIIFLGYTWPQKTLRNQTVRDRRLKVKITGLLGDLDIKTTVASSLFKRLNQTWDVEPFSYAMSLWQLTCGFTVGFQNFLWPRLVVILYSCKIERLNLVTKLQLT